MQNLIRELRRREVFRTAGLYIGIAWITIEVADILLPAFEAPEWIMRGLIIAAVVGFPVAAFATGFFMEQMQRMSVAWAAAVRLFS